MVNLSRRSLLHSATSVGALGVVGLSSCTAATGESTSSDTGSVESRGSAPSLKLPEPPDLMMLLLRTDYSDDAAWARVLAAANARYPEDDWRAGNCLEPVQAAELDGIAPQAIVDLPRAEELPAVAVADAQSMRDDTILFLNLDVEDEQLGRTFRAIPSEVEPIVANLNVANMDFRDFADSVGPDGVFRGF